MSTNGRRVWNGSFCELLAPKKRFSFVICPVHPSCCPKTAFFLLSPHWTPYVCTAVNTLRKPNTIHLARWYFEDSNDVKVKQEDFLTSCLSVWIPWMAWRIWSSLNWWAQKRTSVPSEWHFETICGHCLPQCFHTSGPLCLCYLGLSREQPLEALKLFLSQG